MNKNDFARMAFDFLVSEKWRLIPTYFLLGIILTFFLPFKSIETGNPFIHETLSGYELSFGYVKKVTRTVREPFFGSIVTQPDIIFGERNLPVIFLIALTVAVALLEFKKNIRNKVIVDIARFLMASLGLMMCFAWSRNDTQLLSGYYLTFLCYFGAAVFSFLLIISNRLKAFIPVADIGTIASDVSISAATEITPREPSLQGSTQTTGSSDDDKTLQLWSGSEWTGPFSKNELLKSRSDGLIDDNAFVCRTGGETIQMKQLI